MLKTFLPNPEGGSEEKKFVWNYVFDIQIT